MKKIKFYLITVFIFITSSLSAQTLWNVDVSDYEAGKSWDYEEGIYTNIRDGEAAGFSGINFIPEAGYVFYIDEATIMDYHAVYNELVAKFGKEDLNKDYIDPYISYSPKNISAKVHEDSINEGHTFVYREWNERDIKIRFFWNSVRFWVEAVKIN